MIVDVENQQSAEKDMSDAALIQSLAAVHSVFGRTERAITLLNLALWIVPNDPETLRLMAVLCHRDGRLDDALEFIDTYEKTGTPVPSDLTLIKLRMKGG